VHILNNHNYTAKENTPERILDKGLNMILNKQSTPWRHKEGVEVQLHKFINFDGDDWYT
jgi:hypothetical protein